MIILPDAVLVNISSRRGTGRHEPRHVTSSLRSGKERYGNKIPMASLFASRADAAAKMALMVQDVTVIIVASEQAAEAEAV